ncbi:efflux transporter outer membrane subunit [Brevundimonas subvibrioides]|uniref:efflux transporter outer membrane subunit n=1 Tax=Brevundimonas subvibrioides TaxID=74313 RepID=UPI0022B373B7|nr:efflux transporter outer membrane subunit [Brevundimonas subvibrioides]
MKAQISALALALVAAGGCMSLPVRDPTTPNMATWSVADDQEGQVVLDWWTGFNDPALDRLVERALSRNADLRAADANLRATQALAGESLAARGPGGQVGAGLTRTRVAGLSQPPVPGTPERLSTQTLANVGVGLSWELDLFGGLAANLDMARAQADEARWMRRQVEAGVAAALVRAWAEYRYASALEERIQRRVDVQQQILDSLETAETLGGVSRYDTEAARAALDQARAELPAVGAAQRNAARRIAVLSGDAPGTTLADGRLPQVPTTLAAGDPAGMLRRRPDVAAAERQFAAAAAQARVAVADLYPRISLAGNVNLTADPDRLGDAGATGFSVGPSLTWGLFDMPRLRQRVVAADARSEAALARWEGTTLAALEEADGALDVWQSRREAARLALSAMDASDSRRDLVVVRESAGQASRLARLQAEADALSVQINALQAQSDELQAWISAQLALGAGWRDVDTVAPTSGSTSYRRRL